MASLVDLGGTAATILDQFAAQLTVQGVTLPERQYVASGQLIPWDGAQLGVNLQSIDQGQPGIPVGTTVWPQATVMAAQFAVWIVREIAALSGEGTLQAMIPDAADMDRDGRAAMSDAAALILAAIQIHKNYAVTGPGDGYVIGPCTPVGPEGGLAGHRLLLTVSLT